MTTFLIQFLDPQNPDPEANMNSRISHIYKKANIFVIMILQAVRLECDILRCMYLGGFIEDVFGLKITQEEVIGEQPLEYFPGGLNPTKSFIVDSFLMTKPLDDISIKLDKDFSISELINGLPGVVYEIPIDVGRKDTRSSSIADTIITRINGYAENTKEKYLILRFFVPATGINCVMILSKYPAHFWWFYTGSNLLYKDENTRILNEYTDISESVLRSATQIDKRKINIARHDDKVVEFKIPNASGPSPKVTCITYLPENSGEVVFDLFDSLRKSLLESGVRGNRIPLDFIDNVTLMSYFSFHLKSQNIIIESIIWLFLKRLVEDEESTFRRIFYTEDLCHNVHVIDQQLGYKSDLPVDFHSLLDNLFENENHAIYRMLDRTEEKLKISVLSTSPFEAFINSLSPFVNTAKGIGVRYKELLREEKEKKKAVKQAKAAAKKKKDETPSSSKKEPSNRNDKEPPIRPLSSRRKK